MRSQYESQNTPSGRGAETLADLRLAETHSKGSSDRKRVRVKRDEALAGGTGWELCSLGSILATRESISIRLGGKSIRIRGVGKPHGQKRARTATHPQEPGQPRLQPHP